MKTLDFKIFGSKTTSFGAKNLSIDKVLKISKIPPSIEKIKYTNVNKIPAINTTP